MARFFAAAFAVLAAGQAGASNPVVTDSTGRVLGIYTGTQTRFPEGVRTISVKGYVAQINEVTGLIEKRITDPLVDGRFVDATFLYFASGDCAGDPLAFSNMTTGGGIVIRHAGVGAVYYAAKGSTPQNVTPASQLDGSGVCGAYSGGSNTLLQLLPNDPNVTGFDDTPAVPPLRIEVADISVNSFIYFVSGFEEPTALIVNAAEFKFG